MAGRAARASARVRVSRGARGSKRVIPLLVARRTLIANGGSERRGTSRKPIHCVNCKPALRNRSPETMHM